MKQPTPLNKPDHQVNFHIKKGKKFVVKELFKEIARDTKNYFKKTNNISILDIGTACGELIYFLKNDLKTNGEIWGVDLDPSYIKCGKDRFGDEGINFVVGDALNFNLKRKFNLVLVTSVFSYFDDPRQAFKNVLRHLSPGGLAIVTGLFNDYGIEVMTRYKQPGSKKVLNGFNQYPISKLVPFLNDLGYQVKISEQIMPFDIEPKDNLLRSWTIKLNGKRYMTNGLQLIYQVKKIYITARKSK